ncbi:MAG: hypothetical protein ACRDPE_23420 [Solirubrobacterales bacterium]
MAVTATNALQVAYRIVGNQKKTVFNVAFDSSYESEGEPLTRAQLGLNSIEYSDVTILAGSESEEFPVSSGTYDPVAQKIHLQNGKTSKEVASTKNVEKVVARVESYGN